MKLTLSQEREEAEIALQLRNSIYIHRQGELSYQESLSVEKRIEDLSEDYLELTGRYFCVEYPITENTD